MITRDEIYFNYIRSYIDYTRENKLKFSMYTQLTGANESGIAELPSQAFQNGLLFTTFDFGAEETWVPDQIVLENGLFKCVLVFYVEDNWVEFPIEFPVINIIALTRYNFEQRIEYSFDFAEKVKNSKKHLKLVQNV